MDRPKDKSILSAPQKHTGLPDVGPVEVAAYLRQNAGFLAEHPDLLQILTPPAQRRGDLPLRQDAGRALVEERLEHMPRPSVHERHRYRSATQRPGREQTSESAADDDYPAVPSVAGRPFRAPARVGYQDGSCQVSHSGSRLSASFGPQVSLA